MVRSKSLPVLAVLLAATAALTACNSVYDTGGGGGFGGGWGGGGGLVVIHHSSPTIIVHHYTAPTRVYVRRR